MTAIAESASWESIDASLIRMRRLLEVPQAVGDGVDLSSMLVVDTIARRGRAGKQTRIIDIAAQLSVTPSTASRLVARAESAGLVERSPSPADPRSVILSLTSAGEELNAAAVRFRLASLQDALPNWDATTLETFARLLDEFSRATTPSSS
ncbi:MarR family transcriptional regulator [Leucobacter insecticola]|uniref:MarR family transcriptional regulator n=1 Tax=Leucobacter insecticola TaxID=2714934 RepID=A0A6G8FHW1_9MICO|nr:MarR family transcriptional regulator [Leucobacter insecticola]QIM15947.1 MarR family transcriptional regulator [Leucobacter insecticola]